MSFKPILFNYVPPPTINSPVQSTKTTASSSNNKNTTAVLAKAVILQLQDLITATTYVQDVINAKYRNSGVTLDVNKDPETAKALASSYNGVVPPIITTGMYNNLLDCQFALQGINKAVGNNSTVEADPIMLANLIQINNTVQNSLLIDGDSNQLAIQSLALLKSNNYIYANLITALDIYNFNPGTDISLTVSSNLNTLINNETSLLNSLYGLQTNANIIAQDLTNVLNTYLYQPLSDIVQITAAIKFLHSTSYKTEGKKIFDGLTSIVYGRLLAELAPSYFASDQLQQRILQPLSGITGAMGNILNTVNNSVQSLNVAVDLTKKTVSSLKQSSISTLPDCNPCSQAILQNLSGTKPIQIPGFNGLSKGLQFFGQQVNAALANINSNFSDLENTFIALQKRKNKDFADVLQVMCAMQSAETLIDLGNQLITHKSLNTNPTSISTNNILNTVTTNLTNINPLPIMPNSVSHILTSGV